MYLRQPFVFGPKIDAFYDMYKIKSANFDVLSKIHFVRGLIDGTRIAAPALMATAVSMSLEGAPALMATEVSMSLEGDEKDDLNWFIDSFYEKKPISFSIENEIGGYVFRFHSPLLGEAKGMCFCGICTAFEMNMHAITHIEFQLTRPQDLDVVRLPPPANAFSFAANRPFSEEYMVRGRLEFLF